jgi:ABC-type Zn uptake system ZnuABC Zn-binding protein ZnuA
VVLVRFRTGQAIDQIARETGAKIGGTLYSDALSDQKGPAATYLDMFRLLVQRTRQRHQLIHINLFGRFWR